MASSQQGNDKRSGPSPGFKGVAQAGGRYRAKIGYGREQLHLGVYDSAAEAAHAYNYACIMLTPGKAAPNQLPARLLSPRKKQAVEENVMRLLHPRRLPWKRTAD